MTEHKQTTVKVNALVDEGVAELVAALSAVPGLVTLESCQGGNGTDAFVLFRVGDWRETGRFLFEQLAPRLTPDLRAMVAMRVEAYGIAKSALGSLSMDPRAIMPLTRCVRELPPASVGSCPLMAGDAHRDAITKVGGKYTLSATEVGEHFGVSGQLVRDKVMLATGGKRLWPTRQKKIKR